MDEIFLTENINNLMPKQTDLDILKELENQLRIKFVKTDLKNIDCCKGGTAYYVVDKNENVIGIHMSESYLIHIPPQINKLHNLVYLNFRINEIRDISVLKDLKKLKELDLFDNRIQYISVLKNLKDISELDLSYNQISDISVLKTLSKLQKLTLNNNKISDYSVVDDLNLGHKLVV